MLSQTFKALGDPVRLRLFYLLIRKEELCVCHLTEALQLPQSTVSRHLGVLRHARLVTTRREGKWMHYRLADGVAGMLAGIVAAQSNQAAQADEDRLEKALKACD